ncbi:hypothetical protein [Streptomyces sp. MBT84]|uniref:hypothetical protein n=1 Tax=Streptomyces sp. MBT84 TaxID=1488414 RepID=UPI001C6DF910|nr:hypothetical protein [Streptomyces sp. MBT84]
MALHAYGQVAAASARAFGFAQYDASSLTGGPVGAVSVGGQHFLRERAAAALSDRLCDHVLAVDPDL